MGKHEIRELQKTAILGTAHTYFGKYTRFNMRKSLTSVLPCIVAYAYRRKPTRCHCMLYCTYNMLNMFRAILCPSSGARDHMCVITAYGVQCLGCWLSGVRCRAAGYVSRKRDVARQSRATTLILDA
jgi:hypothetical protein